jgi:hypothetical protein
MESPFYSRLSRTPLMAGAAFSVFGFRLSESGIAPGEHGYPPPGRADGDLPAGFNRFRHEALPRRQTISPLPRYFLRGRSFPPPHGGKPDGGQGGVSTALANPAIRESQGGCGEPRCADQSVRGFIVPWLRRKPVDGSQGWSAAAPCCRSDQYSGAGCVGPRPWSGSRSATPPLV